MRNTVRPVVLVVEKELYGYFVSPIAYIILPVFLLITGYFFTVSLFYTQVASMATAFHNMSILFMFIIPLVTMRLIAEERKTGTLEFLQSLPVTSTTIILGKYIASAILLLIMIACTLVYLIPLMLYGEPDFGPVVTGYFGAILLGLTFLAIGMLSSSLTRNQIAAAVLTCGLIIIFWFFDYIGSFQGSVLVKEVMEYLSLSNHYGDFFRGIVHTQSVVLFLTMIAACLVLTVFNIERRR